MAKNHKKYYAADFEATTKEPVYPYLFTCSRLGEQYKDCIVRYNMADALDYMLSRPKASVIFFHNLNYDFALIYSYINRMEMDIITEIFCSRNKKVLRVKMYREGDKDNAIILRDSYVMFSSDLAGVMKAFTNYEKGETPLFESRGNVKITPEILEYAKTDAVALGVALGDRLKHGFGKLTIASDAMAIFKDFLKKDGLDYYKLFPAIDIFTDIDMRPFYTGGICMLNQKYANRLLDFKTAIYDVNSMYPSRMRDCLMPYGKPYPFKGKGKLSEKYPLMLQKIILSDAVIKDNYAPFLTKGGNSIFGAKHYLTELSPDDKEENRTFYLTEGELDLLFESYEFQAIKYCGGFYLRGHRGYFDGYIDYFKHIKDNRKGAARYMAKIFLNGLYGKFGQNPVIVPIEVSFNHVEQKQEFKELRDEKELNERNYLPVAIYTTAYSRLHLLKAINKIGYKDFIYCDTDSIHVVGEAPQIATDDKFELGGFVLENRNIYAKYLQPKKYAFQNFEGKIKFKCAGLRLSDLQKCVKTVAQFEKGIEIPSFKMFLGNGGYYSQDLIVKV